jgi:hypothetical protein
MAKCFHSHHGKDAVVTSEQFIPDNDAVATPPVKPSQGNKPIDQQLEWINQYVPVGMEPLTADEVVVLPFVAANNLVTRNIGTWTEPDLRTMADLLPGLPALLDHDWDEVGKVVGRVFAAEVQQSRSAPDEVLDRAGYGNVNRQIVKEDGFVQVVAWIFFEAANPVVNSLRFGRLDEVSVGGFNYTTIQCPLCCVSFDDEACPHLLPSPWLDLSIPEIRKLVAPYYERIGLIDLMEISLVTTPACPNAGVIQAR